MDDAFKESVLREIATLKARQDAESWKLSSLTSAFDAFHSSMWRSLESFLGKLRTHEKGKSI